MQPLSVLYVGRLPPDATGSAIVATYLLGGLAARGHRLRALSPITLEAMEAGEAFARAHPRLGVQRYVVPHFATARNRVYDDEGYRRLDAEQVTAALPGLIARERPDLVVAGQEFWAWHVPALAQAHGLPCVLQSHSGGTFTALAAPESTLPGRERLLDGFRRAALIVTVAQHLARDLARLGLTNVRTIPNPVDLVRFAPRPRPEELRRALALGDEDLVVAHVSKLTSVKRPLDIVASAELALRENPRLAYVIVGEGPSRAPMEEGCRQRGIEDRFRFVGSVDHRRVADYLDLADLVVMPSEGEGQALVYLEAQACGRLLLASDIPAAREVIADGETGLLFRKGDVADLAAKTLLAAGDAELRQAIGRNARKAVESHAVEGVVARYEAAFTEVVGRHRDGEVRGAPAPGSR